MAERETLIQTRDGSMKTFIAHPDADVPSPVVIIYMDALGYREALRAVARRFAAAGFFCMLPDLYYRSGDGLVFNINRDSRDPEEMARLMRVMQALEDPMAVSDTEALFAHAATDAAAAPGLKCCVGYCMGGRFVLRAAAALPAEIVAGSAIHPAFIIGDGPDSPHLALAEIEAELYFGFAEYDSITPLHPTLDIVREMVERHGVHAALDVYEGADHGFAIESVSYVEEAADRHYACTTELFRRALGN